MMDLWGWLPWLILYALLIVWPLVVARMMIQGLFAVGTALLAQFVQSQGGGDGGTFSLKGIVGMVVGPMVKNWVEEGGPQKLMEGFLGGGKTK